MGLYGKGMRDCCDSPNQQGQRHIAGCKNDIRLADTILDWHYDNPAFFAVAHVKDGQKIPVLSLREQSIVETAFECGRNSVKGF